MEFNEKLKQLRESRGMSLEEFAKLLNTSKQVLSRYERGENTPKITTVMQYAEKLGVSLQYLVNNGDEQKRLPAQSEEEKELLSIFAVLSDEKKKQLIDYGRFLRQQEGAE